jgi:hypothetical protein
MADKEMVAATLAAGALGPISYANPVDVKIALSRVAAHVVSVYQAILAELEKREASEELPQGYHPRPAQTDRCSDKSDIRSHIQLVVLNPN